jgi:hypothetical protein
MLPPRLQWRLYLVLLSSKNGRIEFKTISEATGLGQGAIRAWLRSRGLETDGESLILGGRKWAALAEDAVNKGVPLETIAHAIPWQRFEALTEEALIRYGFETRRNVRFTSEGRRWEIDVMGVRGSDLICFDSKQWKRGGKGGIVRRSAREQLSRIVALSGLGVKPPLLRNRRITLNGYAALTTLLDTGHYVLDGCFIVPFNKLRSFLDQFYELRGLARPIKIATNI